MWVIDRTKIKRGHARSAPKKRLLKISPSAPDRLASDRGEPTSRSGRANRWEFQCQRPATLSNSQRSLQNPMPNAKESPLPAGASGVFLSEMTTADADRWL